MGMAASQARLLSITSRMADNELRAQIVNNSKMRLATESSKVSEEYVSALNSATMMISNYDAAGNSQYQKLSFNNLTKYSSHNNQYGLVTANGKLLVSESDANNFKNSFGELDKFLEKYGLEYGCNYFKSETFGGSSVQINGYNEYTDEDYVIGSFTPAELEMLYNGDGDKHIGYEASLQSNEYLQFTDLYNQFEIASDNLDALTLETIQEKYLSDSSKFGQLYSSLSSGNAKSTYEGLLKYVEDELVNKDLLSKDSDLYKMLKEGISWNDNTLILSNEEEYSENGNTIYAGAQYVAEDGTTYNELKITKNGSSYTVSLNEDYKKAMEELESDPDAEDGSSNLEINYTFTPQTITPQNGKLTFGFSAQYTSPDGSSDTSNYDVEIDLGKKTCTTKEKITDGEEQQSVIAALFNSFRSLLPNAIKANFAKKEYDENEKAGKPQSELGQAYKVYSDKRKALIEFVYGSSTSFPADNAEMLDDPGYIIANEGQWPTSDAFQKVRDVYILDNLFATYGEPKWGWTDKNNENENADAKVKWYTNLFNRMDKGYKVIEDGLASSNEWIEFALESGLVTMEQVDKSDNWTSLIYTNCADITQVTDDISVTRAEAEYKKAMNDIENKDKRFDIELKNIDTEHNSLQTEYDSVKSVIDKNIERSFKMYS